MDKNIIGRNEGLSTIFAIVVGMSIGGVVDSLDSVKMHSYEHSNENVFYKYDNKIDELSKMKEVLLKQGVDLFQEMYAEEELSEVDVKSLTDLFYQKVSPAIIYTHKDMRYDSVDWLMVNGDVEDKSILPGEYVLTHSEYLDECKAEKGNNELKLLDKCTAEKHHEAHSDGPWGGVFMGGIIGYAVLQTFLFAFMLSDALEAEGYSAKELMKDDILVRLKKKNNNDM